MPSRVNRYAPAIIRRRRAAQLGNVGVVTRPGFRPAPQDCYRLVYLPDKRILTIKRRAGINVASETQAGQLNEFQSANRIATLDGYRALAILSVIAFHYTVRWAPPNDPNAHFPSGAMFDGLAPFEYGWLGVELFFVISGFVILMTLERCRNVGDFVCRRFARLWPPLVVAATLTTAVIYIIGPLDWRPNRYDYLTSILLIDESITSRLLHHSTKWVDGAYWSLAVEIRFYVLAAIVYLAVGRKFIRLWLGVLVAVYFATLLVDYLPIANPQIANAQRLLSFIFFPEYLPYFTLGVCVYEIYSKGSLRRQAIAGMVMAVCIILYSAAFGENIFVLKDASTCILANLIIFILFYLFLIDHSLVSIFKTRYIVALGQASYSLYLIHQSIGIAIMRKCVEHSLPYLIALPITIGVVIAISHLLFRYIEIPAKTWILRKSQSFVGTVERRVPSLSYK